MARMFERFTERARRVVVLAQEEARMLNHNYIGTEHLLLGLIHEGEGVAAKALESMGISLEAVRSQVEEIIGQGQAAPTGHIPFTPRAKKVLELSLREALQLGHNYIGTEHILLGLIREGEGVAAQVLQKLGADLARVRQQVIQLLSGYTGKGEDSMSPPGRFRDRRREMQRLLELALEEAGSLEAAGADPETVFGADHLYLGRLRLDLEDAEALLRVQQVEVDQIRSELDRARAEAAAAPSPGPATDGEGEGDDAAATGTDPSEGGSGWTGDEAPNEGLEGDPPT
jgi:hypothetical protein